MGRKALKLIKKESFLIVIFLLALFLRTYNIRQTLLFHFDQGYHGLAIKSIWENKEFKLLGHKTDVEGIFHSSLFYYLMLPLYLISNWNPVGVSTILAAIDGLSVIFIYLAARKLFNRKVGLISAGLYAISFLAISYSRWLSNVTLIPFLSSLVFFFLSLSKGKERRYFTASLFFAGVIAQLNGAVGFFLLPLLLIYLAHFKKDLIKEKTDLIKYAFFYAFPSTGSIIFDIRNNFLVSRSIINLFIGGKGGRFSYFGLQRATDILYNRLVNLLSYKNAWLAAVVLLIVVYAYKKEKDDWARKALVGSLVYLLSLFIYQGIHGFFITGVMPLIFIVIGWSFYYWIKNNSLRLLGFIVLGAIFLVNLNNWRGFLKPNFNLVPIGTRNLITLEDRLKATDFMYTKAGGEPFRTVIYIIPYYQEEPWDYVFNWYGLKNYGYLPEEKAEKIFTIYEPDYDYGYRLEEWLKTADQEYGEVVSSFKSNDLTVEERKK